MLSKENWGWRLVFELPYEYRIRAPARDADRHTVKWKQGWEPLYPSRNNLMGYLRALIHGP